MATSFNNKPEVKENIISPGPATNLSGEFLDTQSESSNTINEKIEDRIKEIRQDQEPDELPYSVGYYDIDAAVMYYFENILKPTVIENSEVIQVPVLYGSSERWASMQNIGAYRDNKGKITLPLIMYKRINVSKNENIVFPRLDQLYFISKLKWNSKNRYSDYSLKHPTKSDRYALTSIPVYIIANYECIVWTSFIEQMNPILEKIQFSDTTYWGDKNKFKFRTSIDSIDTAVDLEVDTERMVKSTFNINIYGYILPKDFSNNLTTKNTIGPKKIIFTESSLE